jgi:hypothetical protein
VDFFDSETDDLFLNGTFRMACDRASNLPAGEPRASDRRLAYASRLS